MNVDSIDIEKVDDIPDIPREELDMYNMLYEEMSTPNNCTRRALMTMGATLGPITLKIATLVAFSNLSTIDANSYPSKFGLLTPYNTKAHD